ncbi:hypothetical protein FACS1894217_00800 [Clostridia bacterium]|nr:hypothetical protein FACS1894217_00800 [Clostridia bacterium]
MNKKILFFGQHINPCKDASAKALMIIAKKLAESGCEVHCLDSELLYHPYSTEINEDGVIIHTKTDQKPADVPTAVSENIPQTTPQPAKPHHSKIRLFVRDNPILRRFYLLAHKAKSFLVRFRIASNKKIGEIGEKSAQMSVQRYYGKIYRTPHMAWLDAPTLIYNLVAGLHEKYKFDVVIPVVDPFVALVAAFWLKEKNPNITLIIYSLDALSDIGEYESYSAKTMEAAGWEWEKRVFPHCAAIIEMASHEQHYLTPPFNRFADKMYYADPPFLLDNSNPKTEYFSSGYTSFLYMGILHNSFIPIDYSLGFFARLSSDLKFKFYVYGWGPDEQLVKRFEKETNGTIEHRERVPMSEVAKIQKCCDVLVSVGTKNSNQISSKIFEYMSSGGKIVHFQSNTNDVCLPYFDRYPNVIALRAWDSFEENAAKLNDFLSKPLVEVNFEKLTELFPEALPEFTQNIILKTISEVEKQ